ncbi:MAG TPA: TIM barrel protein [Bacteroidales bacterium]|nr:TIM barrel protein [Bacteroidales bacterium]HPF03731.1 TIM barrel protein [Bacteroidales bacterium]HPJ60380.1 TIM barrel protein [Bacteroidales bacterium]HPR12588.1 TIM barrel protein [Bacteroidales bacterium]HRW86585.1 TIM barrel protein [Bacteroidales bacterium]
MKNTSFLTVVLILALSGMLSTLFISCTPKKNIGLQLYSIRDSIRKDVPAAIEKVAQMGYTFVEPAGYGDGKFYGMEPDEFKALCENHGMLVLSSHTSRQLPDSSNYEETMAWWDKCIDAHVAVGAKYIVQPSMGRSAYESIANLKLWCDYFNAVGEKCNAKGIRFGYHNHDREFTTVHGDTVMYDFMLRNTDPEKVMFQLDLYWCVVGGKDPVDYFNKYPGRFELWHIKDKEEVGASGMMDFEAAWAAAEVSGMKYGIVEVEKYNYDQFTSCKMSLDFLNEADYVKMPL